jgi:hypothetical protein
MSAQAKETRAYRQRPMDVRRWLLLGLVVATVATGAVGVRALVQRPAATLHQPAGITSGQSEAAARVPVTGTGPDLVAVAGQDQAALPAVTGTGPDLVQVAGSSQVIPQVTGTGPDLLQIASHRGGTGS